MPPATCPVHLFRWLWLPKAPNKAGVSPGLGAECRCAHSSESSQISLALWGLCRRKEGWLLVVNITALWQKQFNNLGAVKVILKPSTERAGDSAGHCCPLEMGLARGSHAGLSFPLSTGGCIADGRQRLTTGPQNGAESRTPGPSIPGWKGYRANVV